MTITTINGFVHAARTIPSGVTVNATSNAGGPTLVTITPGSFTTVNLMAASIANDLDTQRPITGGSWQGGFELAGSNGFVTLQSSNLSTVALTWVDTNLRDMLGFTGNLSGASTYTATQQARGFWRPDCTIFTEDRYRAAPRVSDQHQAESPNGLLISHTGNMKFRHGTVRWSHCPQHKVWLVDELTVNESLERFLLDTQWGQGISWFANGAKKRITSHDGFNVGHTTVTGWYWKRVRAIKDLVRRAGDVWDGQWSVTIPEMVTDS